jgi:hypothetical protein
MSCPYCSQTWCLGNCPQAQQNLIGQQQGYMPNINGNYGFVLGQTASINTPPTDYGLDEFLDTIADKDDTAACVAFIEKQRQLRDSQIKQLEAMEKQHAESLEKAEKEFMNRCAKYRPSISAELMNRIKKMRAFF